MHLSQCDPSPFMRSAMHLCKPFGAGDLSLALLWRTHYLKVAHQCADAHALMLGHSLCRVSPPPPQVPLRQAPPVIDRAADAESREQAPDPAHQPHPGSHYYDTFTDRDHQLRPGTRKYRSIFLRWHFFFFCTLKWDCLLLTSSGEGGSQKIGPAPPKWGCLSRSQALSLHLLDAHICARRGRLLRTQLSFPRELNSSDPIRLLNPKSNPGLAGIHQILSTAN